MSNATVTIEHTELRHKGGFVPATRDGVDRLWNWLRVKPVDLDQAAAESKAHAEDEAARYVGDWDITIRHVELA